MTSGKSHGLDESAEPKPAVWTPEGFARSVSAYAAQNIATTLNPGEEYENLARFLMGPLERPSPSRKTVHDPSAIIYRFSRDGSVVDKTVDFEDSISLAAHEAPTSSLLFLHGHQSPERLAKIGAWWRLDPAFFQHHLRFKALFGRRELFATPSLLSASQGMITLRYVTIGTREGIQDSHLPRLRDQCKDCMDTYIHNLNLETDLRPGDSIVRECYVHDTKHFSVHQEMTIVVRREHGSWHGIVWLDSGHDLDRGPSGPWRTGHKSASAWQPSFLPTIQRTRGIALRWNKLGNENSAKPRASLTALSQSASRLGCNYGSTLDAGLAADDAFYAVSELLWFSAFSISQFLNLVQSKILPIPETPVNGNWRYDSATLPYHEKVLADVIETLQDNIRAIKARGGPHWSDPNQVAFRKHTERTSITALALLDDYEELLRRAKLLSERCRSNMTMAMNCASIVESKRGIEQAAKVEQLTRLASFFLPLGLTTSFLGMNLSIFGQGNIPIWVWFAISVPSAALTFVVLKLI